MHRLFYLGNIYMFFFAGKQMANTASTKTEVGSLQNTKFRKKIYLLQSLCKNSKVYRNYSVNLIIKIALFGHIHYK